MTAPALKERPATPVRSRRKPALARTRRREAIALVLPSLIPILVLSVAPLVVGIFLAFTDARLVRHPTTPSPASTTSSAWPTTVHPRH